MSVTERMAGAADRLADLDVPVPDAGRVLRRSRRRRGSVYGVAVAALVLGGIGVVATSRTDQTQVATGVTDTTPSPDAPIGLTRSKAFWPDAEHRPDSPVALGRALAAFLGWGDSAEVEFICSPFSTPYPHPDNFSDEARRAWGVPDDCQQLGDENDGKTVQMRISSPATGAEVKARAFPTAEATDSGWAFVEIGTPLPLLLPDGPEAVSMVSLTAPPGTQEVRWWATTRDGEELFGFVPYGSPIRIQAPAPSIVSALVVFLDEHGNSLGARGGLGSFLGATFSCCDVPMQFAHRRAVLAPPRTDTDDTWQIGPDGAHYLANRFVASAPEAQSVGRYTDLDDPLLTDRLVWVIIERDVALGSATQVGDVVHIIDAHTGDELSTFDGPGDATCPIEPGAEPDRCGNP